MILEMNQSIPQKFQLLLQEDIRLSYILCHVCQSHVEVSDSLRSLKYQKEPLLRELYWVHSPYSDIYI